MNGISLNLDEQRMINVVKDRLPDLPFHLERSCGQLSLVVDRKDLPRLCRVLKEDPATRFDYLADICGVDYLGKREIRFQVVYHLYSIPLNHRVRVKTNVTEEDCTVDSVSSIWKTANWHERELYDMFGIEVKGHPDLRRILMPDDWEGHPLRKDYPLKGKGQRDDFSFVPRNERPPGRTPERRSGEW